MPGRTFAAVRLGDRLVERIRGRVVEHDGDRRALGQIDVIGDDHAARTFAENTVDRQVILVLAGARGAGAMVRA